MKSCGMNRHDLFVVFSDHLSGGTLADHTLVRVIVAGARNTRAGSGDGRGDNGR
jgi:hypothetical protein